MPLKEGRSIPGGLPYAGPPPSVRGRFNQRQILVLLVVIIGLPFLYFYNRNGSSLSSMAPGGGAARGQADKIKEMYSDLTPNLKDVMKADLTPPKQETGPKVVMDQSPPPKKPVAVEEPPKKVEAPARLEKSEKVDEPDSDTEKVSKMDKTEKADSKKVDLSTNVDDEEEDDELVKKPVPQSQDSLKKHKQSPNAEKFAERPNFERILGKVIDILPDEVHMRELTRPVDSTGKDRMREMGLRTRAYKKYFDAWEALHLWEDKEGAISVRDDVVQYLRSHKHTGPVIEDGVSDEGGVNGMSLAQTIRAYESYRSFVLKFANLLFPWTAPYFSDHMTLHAHIRKGGRGIVLTAGDDQAPYLLTTIHTFRKLGCTLPIEVMYLGDQDLGEDYRVELEALDGVVTRDIAQMVNDEGWRLAGWAAKPFAILLSSFREVIFIDADSLFFRDPAVLFDDPGYKETGALFFKDRLIMPESKKRWLQQILPKPIPKPARQSRFWLGTSGHMQESGVVVVDKWKHFIPLLLVTRLNGPDRDGNKEKGIIGVYDMVYGDKETFWVGWLLAGDEGYHFHGGDAGIMGMVKDPEDHTKEPEHGEHEHKEPAKPAVVEDVAPNDAQKVAAAGGDAASDGDTEKAPSNEARSEPEHQLRRRAEGGEQPANYTICAPQLLHFDLEGKPLWFNGWLLDNKFADRNKKKFATFESYLIEPREVRDPGAWQLAESNMCCLTSDADKKFDFTKEEMKVLDMIMDRARDIGAYGSQ